MMEIRDLTIFVTVAKTGSITKAAELLGYVQSNITARIQHLENKLGTSLFHRLSRGVSLTASGETLLKYAEEILHLCQEAEQAVQDSETPNGLLRIGAMETTTATRFPSILAKYHQDYPNVELSLTTGPTNHFLVNYTETGMLFRVRNPKQIQSIFRILASEGNPLRKACGNECCDIAFII